MTFIDLAAAREPLLINYTFLLVATSRDEKAYLVF